MALTNQTSIFEAKQKFPEDELYISNPVHAEVSFLITKNTNQIKREEKLYGRTEKVNIVRKQHLRSLNVGAAIIPERTFEEQLLLDLVLAGDYAPGQLLPILAQQPGGPMT